MSRASMHLSVLFLMLCLTWYNAIVPADALEPPTEKQAEVEDSVLTGETDTKDVVYTEIELKSWISEHKEVGGTVSLGCNVTITEPLAVYGIYGSITIDTGEFGLIFDGATLSALNMHIIGEGIKVPVVEVLRTGSGDLFDVPWNNLLLDLNITANGKNGIGGTALRLSRDIDGSIDLTSVEKQGLIRAYGTGAIGVELAVPLELYCLQIEVSGDGSRGVVAPDGTTLYYCRLTADGEDATAVNEGNVILDTCTATPEPPTAQNRSRSLLPESSTTLYLPMKQYDDPAFFDWMDYQNAVLSLSGGTGYASVYRLFPIYVDDAALSQIDTSTLGKVTIPYTLLPPFLGLGLENTELLLTVDVRDAALPCIYKVTSRDYGIDGKFFFLNFWNNYDPENDDILLWRSNDEGETWTDATQSEEIEWYGNSVHFKYSTLENSVWFVLEAPDIGESNVVILSEKDGLGVGGNGGDRTGTDRGGVTPPDKGNGKHKSRGGKKSETKNDLDNEDIKSPEEESESPDSEALPAITSDLSEHSPQQENSGDYALEIENQSPDNGQNKISGDLKNEVSKKNYSAAAASNSASSTKERPPVLSNRILVVADAESAFSDSTAEIDIPRAVDNELEQSAPQLPLPVKKIVMALLGLAVLLFAALFSLRLYKHRGWKNE